jgi:1-acyl-sn-glycerol-3-phosphate acyltransferase
MLKIMTEAAKRIHERGLSVLLFPEGSRARGEMMEFKEGAAYIAIKSQTPIIPFALRGTREVLPVGSFHLRGLPVDFLIGPPIPVEGMTLKDRERLTALMRERVVELLGSIGNQPAPAKR